MAASVCISTRSTLRHSGRMLLPPMSLRSQRLVAFAVAILLTALGWHQVMIHYVGMSTVKLALFFPFLVLAGARDFVAIVLSFVQWPLLAGAFSLGLRRWKGSVVLGALGAVYALAVVAALVILRAHEQKG